MSETVIFTGGEKKHAGAMAVLAMNIRDTLPDIADKLIIFHDGISLKDQKLINSVFPTEFRRFEFGISFMSYRKNTSLRYFSQMVFCKYECFNLLNEFERVIWTDYDVVINSNLNELKDGSRGGLQLVRSDKPLSDKFKIIDGVLPGELIKDHDLNAYTAVNTPLLVLTREIGDYNKYYKWCVENTEKYARYLNMPEEGIFSLLLLEFNIPSYELKKDEYAWPYKGDSVHASIDHAVGQPKYWNGLHHDRWEAYYRQWLSMGGSPVKKSLVEKSDILKKNINEMIGRR